MYKIDDLILKANHIHNNKYEYDVMTYKKTTEKMRIICPIHGEFWQSMHEHINKGQGCPICGKIHPKKNFVKSDVSIQNIFDKCNLKFQNKFLYPQKNILNVGDKVRIICPKHGEFEQRIYSHYKSKYGCPKCAKEYVSINNFSNTDAFIEKARKKHGDKYDYSKTNYINVNTKVCIICREHGEFWQLPYNHLSGNGCPFCGIKKTNSSNKLTELEFINRSELIHNNKYDYSNITYKNYRAKVDIKCPIHGIFGQSPEKHLQGQGCPKCANQISKAESEIYDYCCTLLGKDFVKLREREIISPYELDIYIPSLKIAIEYNGLRWHSEQFGKDKWYHYNKMKLCNEKNIKLIQIFEDEYVYHKEIVLSKIKHLINKDNSPKIYGRKCNVKVIDYKLAKTFLEKNHIQGWTSSTVYLGGYYKDELIAVMSFIKENNNSKKWELNRFATNINYHCVGIGGKLFKYFILNYEFDEIKSFADKRWTINENNIYTQLGFEFIKNTEPDYRYYNNSNGIIRYHKFNFRKERLHKKYGLPLTMTESDMMEQLGYSKIYDCGLIKYTYKK